MSFGGTEASSYLQYSSPTPTLGESANWKITVSAGQQVFATIIEILIASATLDQGVLIVKTWSTWFVNDLHGSLEGVS